MLLVFMIQYPHHSVILYRPTDDTIILLRQGSTKAVLFFRNSTCLGIGQSSRYCKYIMIKLSSDSDICKQVFARYVFC